MTSRSPNKVTALTWLSTVLGLSHLTLVYATGRLRWDHVAADALILGVAWSGPRLQRFLRGGLALWLTGMLLDSQGLWLFLRGPIHTGDLWELERQWFPAPGGTHWPEWWATRFTPAMDLLCGFAYAAYLYEVFILAIFFFVKKDSLFERLCWGFLAANAIGVVIYVLYPAAPPWYVLQYGPGPADLAAPPQPRGDRPFRRVAGHQLFRELLLAQHQRVRGHALTARGVPLPGDAVRVVARLGVAHLHRAVRVARRLLRRIPDAPLHPGRARGPGRGGGCIPGGRKRLRPLDGHHTVGRVVDYKRRHPCLRT